MKDLVTVLIPVYNRQAYLAECLDSVLAQTYDHFEILLIDDGSTDRSVAICRDYQQKDPRIRLHLADHGGVSAARNLGLELAQGEYVFFMDSDDAIHPCLLESMVESLRTTDAAMVGTAVVSLWAEKWKSTMEKLNKRKTTRTVYLDHSSTLQNVFSENTPLSVIGGVMMRRDYIGTTRFRTDLYIGEDFYFIYENLIKGCSTVFLIQAWYYARLHQHNTWDFTLKGFENRLYRRKLIWTSEEKLGRPQYANAQKAMVFGVYLRCLKHIKVTSQDAQKMRKCLRQHRKVLFPAMRLQTKIKFYACVYIPFIGVFFKD